MPDPMWTFCLRSLAREYGWRFVRHVGVRHPIRTIAALVEASRLDLLGESVAVPGGSAAGIGAGPVGTGPDALDRPPSIVGVGFCLKPVSPPCPSGRANHDCEFLERPPPLDAAGLAGPCRTCLVRDIGTKALRTGSAFYVMTSARDILDDVFAANLRQGLFPNGLFVLCRYSFGPFAVGLLASGIAGRLYPLEQGDCRDYRTWLLADRGIKHEQTIVDGARMAAVAGALDACRVDAQPARYERRGNVHFPSATGSDAGRAAAGP
jgi:hypothetical protein